MTTRVLVVGGTRGTGAQVMRVLALDGIEVRVLARHLPGMSSFAGLPTHVNFVTGDVARPGTVAAAMEDVGDIVYTTGARSYVSPRASLYVTVRGIRQTIDAASTCAFLSSMGADRLSFVRLAIDAVRGNGIRYKLEVEAERMLSSSGLDVVAVRAGIQLDRPAGQRDLYVEPARLSLHIRSTVGRADVARVLVDCLTDRGHHSAHPVLDVMWASRRFPRHTCPTPPVRTGRDPQSRRTGQLHALAVPRSRAATRSARCS